MVLGIWRLVLDVWCLVFGVLRSPPRFARLGHVESIGVRESERARARERESDGDREGERARESERESESDGHRELQSPVEQRKQTRTDTLTLQTHL